MSKSTPGHQVRKLPSITEVLQRRKPVRDVNSEMGQSLSRLDRIAVWITDHVGTMGFFLVIFGWTVLWCGYNILASEIPALHWAPFDPFPAFVAYLLMSNVIQILLMPLIMVGQNQQAQHAEKRAQSDFEVNIKAEQEIEAVLRHLEYQNAVLMTMLEKLCVNREEAISELRARGISEPTGWETATTPPASE